MLTRILQSWWLILAWLLAMFGTDFLKFNVMELFASIAIVVGAALTLIRWWLGHRKNTLLGLKQVSNSWQGLDKQNKSRCLEVELKYSPRKSYQVSQFRLIIADRNCDAPYGKPFLPRKDERHKIKFLVPSDIIGDTNSAYVTVVFAGTTFRTDMFQVTPYAVTSHKGGCQN